MLVIIGLIVAVYALCRLAQVVFEMTAESQDSWKGPPFPARFLIVAVISAIGITFLLVLTFILVIAGLGNGGV